MNHIIERPKKTPVFGEYDVAVIGGGIAGISAALTAARKGAKTILLEREFALGGLATLGLVAIYLPLCDGYGKQVSFGIAEELLRLSVKYGNENCNNANEERQPQIWMNDNYTLKDKIKYRYASQYNASMYSIECEQLLLENGVKILYGCHVCDVLVEECKIKAVILEEKSGRKAVMAKAFVDCTGDADICYLSGAPTFENPKKNSLGAWYYSHEGEKFKLNMYGIADSCNFDNVKIARENGRYSGLNAESITRFMQDAHASIREHFTGFGGITPDHALANLATIPQLRMTRKLVGEYGISTEDVHKYIDNSIGMVADWRDFKKGDVYEVPFTTLYSSKVKNLACAGRCISSTEEMWDVMRVIPCCAVTGQAAGLAAAMSDDFTFLNVTELQKELQNSGVVLHEKDL